MVGVGEVFGSGHGDDRAIGEDKEEIARLESRRSDKVEFVADEERVGKVMRQWERMRVQRRRRTAGKLPQLGGGGDDDVAFRMLGFGVVRVDGAGGEEVAAQLVEGAEFEEGAVREGGQVSLKGREEDTRGKEVELMQQAEGDEADVREVRLGGMEESAEHAKVVDGRHEVGEGAEFVASFQGDEAPGATLVDDVGGAEDTQYLGEPVEIAQAAEVTGDGDERFDGSASALIAAVGDQEFSDHPVADVLEPVTIGEDGGRRGGRGGGGLQEVERVDGGDQLVLDGRDLQCKVARVIGQGDMLESRGELPFLRERGILPGGNGLREVVEDGLDISVLICG